MGKLYNTSQLTRFVIAATQQTSANHSIALANISHILNIEQSYKRFVRK